MAINEHRAKVIVALIHQLVSILALLLPLMRMSQLEMKPTYSLSRLGT